MPAASLPPLPRSPSGLVLTGERTLPGVPEETYWFQRHVVAYRLAAARVGQRRSRPRDRVGQRRSRPRDRVGQRRSRSRDRVGREVAPGAAPLSGEVVLDAGCGEGYGLEMLAGAGARRVIGVDLEPQVVAHVEATYAARSSVIEAHAAELMSLPLADDEVDLTVSFQVIEHLHDIPGYLASLRRVTRPQGEVLLATPNRLTFTPDSDVPVNPFHTREFTAAELTDELERAGLRVVSMLGIHHGRRLRTIEAATRRAFPDHLTASAPDGWPAWLRTLVPRIGADWFEVRTDDLDASLDLLAVCRVPRA